MIARLWLLIGVLASPLVQADPLKFPAKMSIYGQECGSCHVPYPPSLLGRGEWQQITNQLDQHFGVNASLDEKTRQRIHDYLQHNSSPAPRAMAAKGQLPRITQSPWYKREHRNIGPNALKVLKANSMSSCQVCHGITE
ncbi:cytochrome C [Agitococcus lubricus]|uniref:Diheme cytochrome c n=1 Tax=Agitococcus lubricus TaxID=1077255 RepID=A0A2T5J410_9GAMM|nr:cytochrome C [Agitococcus lubricus]PTQ91288.1 diheme cytochrome c [Agitococcus lubricus]